MLNNQKRLSTTLALAATGFKGIAELRLCVGVIMDVDTTNFTASVRTTQGVFDNVKLPIPNYSAGTGIYSMPSINDYCVIGSTESGMHFVVAFYSAFSAGELSGRLREAVEPKTQVIKSPKEVKINVESSVNSCIIDVVADANGNITASTVMNQITKDSNNQITDTEEVSSVTQDGEEGNIT